MDRDSTNGDTQSTDSEPDPRRGNVVLGMIVGSSRFGVLLAIFGLGLAATLLLVYSTLVVFKTIWDTITSSHVDFDHAKHLSVIFIELTDLFLLGTVLYIIGIGLYELFIDSTLPLPKWLRINTIEELKSKLVGVIVVLLSVSFFADVVEGNAGDNLLDLGIATGVVILALGVYSYLSAHSEHAE